MSELVPPHGSKTLKSLALEDDALTTELEKAKSLPKITCSSREFGDVIMLGIGGFTPLEGFMTKLDWHSVCDNMTTSNGTFWPIPITLSTDDEEIKEEDEVALVNSKTDEIDRKSTRLNSSHVLNSYAVFCLQKYTLGPIT